MDAAPKAGIGTAGKASAKHGPDGKPGHAQMFLALTALGVVFGDIGTSPLYAFSVALNATGHAPGTTQVLGVVSSHFGRSC
jgi:KUP system potassium uptake protein